MNLFGLFGKKNMEGTKVSTEDFQAKLQEVSNAQLIDVRTPEEFRAGYLANAQNINFYDNDFKEALGNLDKEKPLFLYCRSGNRSGKAAKMAVDMGFQEVLDMDGGMIQWGKENRPVQQ